ncbi:MAG: AAA family ATPase, partial [Chloroflexota bacterium]
MTIVERPQCDLNFFVAEALPKDVGRGIARLDPKDLAAMGLHSGDVISITGKRSTAARVMPAYAPDRGKCVVQIDGIARENAQIGLGEQVEVRPVAVMPARAVTLMPAAPSKAQLPGKDGQYLVRVLEGIPLMKGDRVRATLFGSRYQEFVVEDLDPERVVAVHPGTIVKVKGEGAPAVRKEG